MIFALIAQFMHLLSDSYYKTWSYSGLEDNFWDRTVRLIEIFAKKLKRNIYLIALQNIFFLLWNPLYCFKLPIGTADK